MRVIFFIIFYCFTLNLYSFEIKTSGIPSIHNYKRLDYNAGNQNWGITQTENHHLYFANNSGLLEFDGTHWELYAVPNGTVIRAVMAEGNRVYVGAFAEFGYFENNSEGEFIYHSLSKNLNKSEQDFDHIWNIHKTSGGIIFQSFYGIFNFNGDTIKITKPKSKFHFSYNVNGIIYVYDELNGLMVFNNNQLQYLSNGDFFKGTEIWSILPISDGEFMVGTAFKGFYKYNGISFTPWEAEVNTILKRDQLYCGIVLGENYYAFGTVQNGLLISDKEGRILNQINRDKGLQNNTILSQFNDREGNLWLGLDNGIDLLEINSPISFFQEYYDIGTGYDAIRIGEDLYLGTNQGLFMAKWDDFLDYKSSSKIFTPVYNTRGQVWKLDNIGGELFCCHNNGLFLVSGINSSQIASNDGSWCVKKIPDNPDYMVVGNYGGISLLKKTRDTWEFVKKIEGFKESSRMIEFDHKGRLWVSHGFIGVFKIELNDTFDEVKDYVLYGKEQGFPSNLSINVFKIDDEIVFTTENGIYKYDENNDRFVPYSELNEKLQNQLQISYLKLDNENNIWYSNNNKFGVLRQLEDGNYSNITAPFAKINGLAIQGFESVSEIDKSNILFGVEDGFAHYSVNFEKDYGKKFLAHIKTMGTSREGFIINGEKYAIDKNYLPEIKNRYNDVWFEFSSTYFEGAENSLFSYKLEGFDLEWSNWMPTTYKEYTNLPGGEYTFKVKAKNTFGFESEPSMVSFIILSPWYKTNVAFMCYAMLFLLLLLFTYWYYKRSIEKSKQKEKERQQAKFKDRENELKQAALLAEKETIRHRNEKLRATMKFKEKELANSTMGIIQKNKFMAMVKSDLQKINMDTSNPSVKSRIKTLVKRIDKDIDNEKQWKVFEVHFEQVHEEFLKRLQQTYPGLGPKDLKLCAYIRMNMSSKEIASLMNISVRGVEISRYRLRKKMELNRSANLSELLMKI